MNITFPHKALQNFLAAWISTAIDRNIPIEEKIKEYVSVAPEKAKQALSEGYEYLESQDFSEKTLQRLIFFKWFDSKKEAKIWLINLLEILRHQLDS